MSHKEKTSKATVDQFMSPEVISAAPGDSVAELRDRMVNQGISALPVVDPKGSLLGIVTSTDVLRAKDPEQRAAAIMSDHVYTLPPYAKVDVAARLMRNHGIHHVVITLGSKVAGVLASYDLLALLESHRYVAKGKPTRRVRGGGRRRKLEVKLAKARQAREAGEAPPEEETRERLNAILGQLSRRNAAVEREEGPARDSLAEEAVAREYDAVLNALGKEGRDQIDLVGRALEHLDDGDYGNCEDCKQKIAVARLEALPYAITCVDCARKREAALV